MDTNPYQRFNRDELILRDELAIDRTLLANERTVLSYLRGAITLVIAGVTFIHFVEDGFLRVIGVVLVPLGFLAGVVGILRYRRMNLRIQRMRRQ
jgi:putative membrane protein